MAQLQNNLPPGWDCRFDHVTGKQYFINHFTKTTTWEDPRGRHVHHPTSHRAQNTSSEHIPLQHGSPDLRRNYVYPSQPSPIPAFQMPGQYSPKFIPLQEMRNNSRMSPLLVRTSRTQDSSLSNVLGADELVAKIGRMFPAVSETQIRYMLEKYNNRESVVISTLQEQSYSTATSRDFVTPPPSRSVLIRASSIQDSSLTNVPDTDESVAKINSMFPTVSDTHIRLLLKKYHNREAVVISALQVEKHPITTPGPFATPPPSRNMHPSLNSSLQMTPPLRARTISRGDSPVIRYGSVTASTYTDSPRIGDGFRNSPRTHSSPKLKLRYMKSIFPKAEETIILDILCNNDNNIQKTSDALKEMGYERKDPVKMLQQQVEARLEEQRAKERELLRAEAASVPKIRTKGEKAEIKSRLEEKYKDIPERVISMALDSVHYDEDRGNQILQIMVQEDSKPHASSNEEGQKEHEEAAEATEVDSLAPATVIASQSRQSLKSLLKSDKSDGAREKLGYSRVIEESGNMTSTYYKSPHLSNTFGANPTFARGANDKLLLLDYVSWQGPDPDLRTGPQKGLAQGPDAANLSGKTYTTNGPNADLRKGPKLGLARGSIFQQLRNVVSGESRGK